MSLGINISWRVDAQTCHAGDGWSSHARRTGMTAWPAALVTLPDATNKGPDAFSLKIGKCQVIKCQALTHQVMAKPL
jgi:hypothetical protein